VDEAIRAAGMGVVTVPDGQEQPLGILAAAQRLRQGAAIALAADRAAGEARRIVRPFLGGQMAVPAAPFALAATSGAPLFVVFAVKLGPRHYRFTCHPPIAVTGRTHAEREAAMAQAATAYLERLRDVVRAHPEQWHDFGAQLPVR
jgi:lauroyl/myristoyl acyltransferase